MHSAEKVRDTALDDEKHEVLKDRERPIGKHMTDGTQETRVMTALCNQSDAFTSVFRDDESCYLFSVG